VDSTGDFLDLPLRAFVDGLAAEEPAPGGGSAAALAVAMAAALIAKVARASPSWLERESAVAQAERLRQRTAPLAQADAEAYEEALAALNLPSELEPEVRGMAIGEVLGRAVEVPLAIADAGADAAVLAAVAAERGTLDRRADAIAAALLASAGTQVAAHLVAVNLVVTPEDDRVRRARAVAEVASAAARSALHSTPT
jgi:formiminotetrahydrofolate cyclodeaminase